jgi:hypothetical protein
LFAEIIPAFINGGVQQGRIKNFTGKFTYSSDGVPTPLVDGDLFYEDAIVNNITWGYVNSGPYYIRAGFDPSRVTSTGPDVAGANFSKRLWRRVS